MEFEVSKGALFALAAAASWGGGDFSGGMGVKAAGGRLPEALRFIILAHTLSFAVLVSILWTQEPAAAHGAAVLWAIVGGGTGALGLVTFYIALSRGGMGASAAVSGLLAAAIPAAVSSMTEGPPGMMRIAGFLLAGGAIWWIALGESAETRIGSKSTVALAICGGAAFGVYFVALKLASPLGFIMPMAIARATSLALCVPVLMAITRGTSTNVRGWTAGWKWAVGVALLDTGGNLLFMAATRLGRLDVASVLASLYPAGTILLAAWYLRERPNRRQIAGMVAALAAVAMITL